MVPVFSSKCTPQLSIADSEVKRPLCFALIYVQPKIHHNKRRTVEEAPLQSIHSPQKIWTIRKLNSEVAITIL